MTDERGFTSHFQVSPSDRTHRCGDQLTRSQLIQALHLQIRKLRPKFTKVIVWAGMPWAGRVSVKALRRGGGERRENKESEKQTTENRTETGI